MNPLWHFAILSVLVVMYIVCVPLMVLFGNATTTVVLILGAIWLCIAVSLYGSMSTMDEWVYGVLCACYVVWVIAHVIYCVGIFMEEW